MIINVATATGTQDLWKQERILLYINAADKVLFYTDLEGSALSPIATYTPPSGGDLYIDVTDYVRAYPNVEHLYVVDTDTSTTYDTEVEVKGLINPANMRIPYQPNTDDFYIVPPSVIYSDSMLGYSTRVGIYTKNTGKTYKVRSLNRMSSTAVADGFALQYAYSGGGILASYDDGQWTEYLTFRMRNRQCDHDYAFVRWVSPDGATYCHVLEYRKYTIASANGYSLLPIDNEYITVKGREEGMSLYIDGLNRYDLWYYSGILTSSKVEVSLNGYDWSRVDVETKSVSLPDGEAGTDGKLEIKIKYKRYDAVAM